MPLKAPIYIQVDPAIWPNTDQIGGQQMVERPSALIIHPRLSETVEPSQQI